MVQTARNLAHLSVQRRHAPSRCSPARPRSSDLLTREAVALRPARRSSRAMSAQARKWSSTFGRTRSRECGARGSCRAARLCRLGRVMLETRFPLDLFRAWSYVEPDSRMVCVYPRPRVQRTRPPNGAQAGAGTARARASGNDDFAGLRAYQASDSPRRIAWKAVARSRRPAHQAVRRRMRLAELWLECGAGDARRLTTRRLSLPHGWVLAAERAGRALRAAASRHRDRARLGRRCAPRGVPASARRSRSST